ncbi:MAG: phosphoethanolamine--lipid A transferase [Burkholderiales bacterium]|nr:MAG: phosphoethanolamine--lipid A transferase [Burkholderiales bacterium]
MSRRVAGRRPEVASEWLILAVSVFIVATQNGAFWRGLLASRDPMAPGTWAIVAASAAMLVATHVVLAGLLGPRAVLRPVLAVLLMAAAAAGYYSKRYGVVIDPSMIRNVLATDAREAGELLTPGFLGHMAAFGALPAATVLWVRIRPRPLRRAIALRAGLLVTVALVGIGALLAVFQDFGSTMRNQRTLRYTITPANVVWSLGAVATAGLGQTVAPHLPPDPATRDAATRRRPTLLVVVVGETARAANWQLAGYARPTTPTLAARRDLVSLQQARACGTSTEVSLPCMFSPYGRADYDEARIKGTDSLLHVLAHAGLQVLWRDNQAGCKGVCAGLPEENVSRSEVPGLCADGRCLDEILLHGLDGVVQAATGDLVVVLHQLGNHGPAYFRRYPDAFKRWTPACERNELRECSRDEIVNAYDNALAYTDQFLSRTIAFLEGQRGRFDVALTYVSDHGESLGEHGLYLHGMPYAIAPREQVEVPMFWWIPEDAAQGLRVDLACLRTRASGRISGHDELYHSIVGLLDVHTPRYLEARDLFAGCRTR